MSQSHADLFFWTQFIYIVLITFLMFFNKIKYTSKRIFLFATIESSTKKCLQHPFSSTVIPDSFKMFEQICLNDQQLYNPYQRRPLC